MTTRDPWAPVPASDGNASTPVAPTVADEVSPVTDLADLFGEPDLPTDAPVLVSDLPEEPIAVETDPGSPAAEPDALADLFNVATEPSEPAVPVSTARTPKIPSITLGSVPPSKRPRRESIPTVINVESTATDQTADQPAQAQPAPAQAVQGQPDHAQPVQAQPGRSSTPVSGSPLAKSSTGSMSKRYTDADRLWPIVDMVMSVAGAETRIQNMVGRLELTRDSLFDDTQREELFSMLKPMLASNGIRIPDPTDVPPVLQMAYDELIGISVLGELWRDDSVTEILVDRWDSITVERGGRLERTRVSFRNPEHASSVARSLALRVSQRQVSRSINLVTAELPRARVQFAYGPVVRGGLAIAIRKFSELLNLDALRRFGALDEQMESFLRDAVQARAGVLVSGGTGTGKTTIINLLSSFIPDTERVVTIEDAFELSLANQHVVSLQTKEASSADDTVSVTLSQLLRATLRLRPDRIIVGEIREGEGAEVMLAASNTGHDGTMTTIHANSADMAVNERLVDLVRQNRNSSDDAIRRTIASAFDIIVQVDRGRRGNRFISSICQIDRSLVTGGIITPTVIFTGEDDGSGKPTFRRVGSVRPDTALGRRLSDAGSVSWIER